MFKEQVCANILGVLKPGDVINQVAHPKWWQFWLYITYAAIRWHQKRLLGKHSNYRDTHTMMYLGNDKTFSVELPKAVIKPVEEYCISDMSIYRINYKLSPDMIHDLRVHASVMEGENYDVGQLLDIAINGILGYNHLRKVKAFDFGSKNKVCSVGVRALFERLNQEYKIAHGKKWLFYSLNPIVWHESDISEYKGTDVEATTPSHFANSHLFCREFKLVARFKNGKRTF